LAQFAVRSWDTSELIEPSVIPEAIAGFLSYVPCSVMFTRIPDWAQHLGLRNKGSFFIDLTVAIANRPPRRWQGQPTSTVACR
jgi:hypothetical protein